MDEPTPSSTAPARVSTLALAAALVGGLALALGLTAGPDGLPGLVYVVVVDLPVALAIFLAAGGWGWLALRQVVPTETPPALLAVTSVAAGLWLLGTAALVAGSIRGDILAARVAWPVVGIGLSAAAWAVHRRVRNVRIPSSVTGGNLLGLVLVVAAALWLAGASMPPGYIGRITADYYDVLSYHLQIPREFFEVGRITALPHNTYSHYPLGGEMLFLLGMCLKGDPWAGAYAAKFTHGLWGVLAIAAAVTAMPDPPRKGWTALLLATVPLALSLSWLAFIELSQLAYLAVALAWLRTWRARPMWRAAAMTGLACGGACATKYLAVGFVAAPVLAVMLVAGRARGRPLAHALVAAGVCAALASPWLIRNVVETGNPVFPLATGVFGTGHWTAEQAARWDRGHAPPSWGEKLRLLGAPFVGARGFGPALGVLGLVGAGLVVGRWRRVGPVDRFCVGILAIQALAWAIVTHMPPRFLLPAVVPLAVLGSSACGAIARRWGRVAANGAAVATAVVGLACAWGLYRGEMRQVGRIFDSPAVLHGTNSRTLARVNPMFERLLKPWRPGQRLLFVGDAQVYNFPKDLRYSSAWEMGALVRAVRDKKDAPAILRYLRRERGMTHVLIHWGEIRRLLDTYGWWDEITPGLVKDLAAAGAERFPLMVRTAKDGRQIVIVELLVLPEEPTASASRR
ncbi:MAG: ArnT family glycosyltransferase [Planctomycetota bacterium]